MLREQFADIKDECLWFLPSGGGTGGGGDVEGDREEAVDEAEDASNRQEVMVRDPTRGPRLVVRQRPDHQRGQSNRHYDPAGKKTSSVSPPATYNPTN